MPSRSLRVGPDSALRTVTPRAARRHGCLPSEGDLGGLSIGNGYGLGRGEANRAGCSGAFIYIRVIVVAGESDRVCAGCQKSYVEGVLTAGIERRSGGSSMLATRMGVP